MHFGLYLVKQGTITAEQYVAGLESQLASRPQVGALAIEIGKLSVKEVFQILRVQADRPKKKFGEIAVEAGLLTSEDLAIVLYHQSVRVRPLSEILVEMGFTSQREIDQQTQAYQYDKQFLTGQKMAYAG